MAFALLWIFASELILDNLMPGDPRLPMISMVKGMAFVLVTSGLLYFYARRLTRKLLRLSGSARAFGLAYRSVFRDSPHPMWVYLEQSDVIVSANRAAQQLFGCKRHDFRDIKPVDLLHPDDRATFLALRDALALQPQLSLSGKFRHRLANGSYAPLEVYSQQISYRGQAARLVFAYDVSERELNQSQIAAASHQLALTGEVIENSVDAIMITDAHNSILSVNRAFTQITGYHADEVVGFSPHLLASGRHDRTFYTTMWESLRAQGRWEGEIWNRRKNGQDYPEWLRISVVKNKEGHTTHHVAHFTDISDRKVTEAQIQRLAFFDSLTGLPNRLLAQDRLRAACASARRHNRRVGLLLIDIDHFKVINDSLGHQHGDALLKLVSERLRLALRSEDTVARVGGDEFLVVLPDLQHDETAATVAADLLQSFDEPLAVSNHTLHVTLSIGISIFPGDATDVDTLLRNADAALFAAKQGGRNAYHFFTTALHEAAVERLRLESDLRQAISRQQLTLYYQPQVNTHSRRVTGFEALLRWPHPLLGLISPARFIPVAEETGLIVPLGTWVLKESVRQAAEWHRQGHRILMAVNVSAKQFRQPDFFDIVAHTLESHNFPAQWLELELTESLVMDDSADVLQRLHRLRELGVQLAIDDFGTGYSSLHYLRRLPVTKLKIDQSFVRSISNPEDEAVVACIIQLANSLHLHTIAEGVEQEYMSDKLETLGCDELQGYLFGRPEPADTASALLREAAGTSV
ncbi:EAL domain-containing protein [Chitinivorax sp. PXF-14]|uniref:putative bifunctional diguanylate cyclase/phosphodiesterase n=1 Tax=Chitinivorax sp. PXF-14 TaxID=3230488 RepID=UPI003465DE56